MSLPVRGSSLEVAGKVLPLVSLAAGNPFTGGLSFGKHKLQHSSRHLWV